MMSIESFVKMLRPRVEARTPFLAYWHPNGMAILNTGECTIEEYDVNIEDGKTLRVRKHHAKTDAERDSLICIARRKGERIYSIVPVFKSKKVKASTINKMRKFIAGLQKDPRIGQVYVIEFDGTNLIGEWPDPDVLSSLNVEVK